MTIDFLKKGTTYKQWFLLPTPQSKFNLFIEGLWYVYVCPYKQGTISTLSNKILKLDQFTYLCSNILSIEIDVNIRRRKAWTAIDMLIMWKSGFW